MGSAARRLAYNPAGLPPKLMIDVYSSIAKDKHSLPTDPGEASAVLKERAKRYPNDPGFQEKVGTAAAHVENVVRAMIDNMAETGEVHPGLLSFYASRGVPFDTLEKLASGGLPMDDASRAARAKEMGLDPDMVWTRHDIPMLDHARLQHRGGLTYAGFTPWLADQAAVSKGQQYPLIAPKEIIGLQPFDAIDSGLFGLLDEDDKAHFRRVVLDSKGLASSGLSHNWADRAQSYSALEAIQRAETLAQKMQNLNQQAGSGALAGLVASADNARSPHGPLYGWGGAHAKAAPGWKELESKSFPDNPLSTSEEAASKMIQERAKNAGAKGTLVSDEGGVSVAFMTPSELRHADLSILDPEKKGMPGYFYSILPAPAAVAAGAAGQGQDNRGQVTKELLR